MRTNELIDSFYQKKKIAITFARKQKIKYTIVFHVKEQAPLQEPQK